MSPLAVARRRRATATRERRQRTSSALSDAAQAFRGDAQVYLNAGRPDLAQPYVDEAEMFEAASRWPVSM